MKKLGFASDHAGYELKEFVKGYCDGCGYGSGNDYGCYSSESVDYPDYAHAMGRGYEAGEFELGVAICGSGNGISMALNKHKSIRAALCWTSEIAELARLHNDANVCVLPARFITKEEASNILDKFFTTAFEGGRHCARVNKI